MIWLYVCKWSEFWFQYSWRWRHLQKIKTADSTFAQNPDAINVCRSSRESIHNTRLKNYSAGFNHAEWWRTDWGRRTTCWVKNRCCPVPDRNWPVQWPPHHSPALLASLPGWSSRALGISCWAYFKVLCILADYRHSGHASLFISHEKTGWPLLESPSRNSKWSHHGIKQQSRSIVTLRSIDLTVRSRSVAPMEDDIGLLAPHSW